MHQMINQEQRTLAAQLLLERVELKRDIAQLKADLVKRAEAFVKLGNLLRSSPHVINLDDQEMPPDQAARAQKFSSEEFDSKRIAVMVQELRTKADRLAVVEQEIRGMGYSPE
jgi:chorismate mutase